MQKKTQQNRSNTKTGRWRERDKTKSNNIAKREVSEKELKDNNEHKKRTTALQPQMLKAQILCFCKAMSHFF